MVSSEKIVLAFLEIKSKLPIALANPVTFFESLELRVDMASLFWSIKLFEFYVDILPPRADVAVLEILSEFEL